MEVIHESRKQIGISDQGKCFLAVYLYNYNNEWLLDLLHGET